jgi:hypothetical protein
VVVLAGFAGVITFVVSLTTPFVRRRNRTIAMAVMFVGTAAVVGALGEAPDVRGAVVAISGAVLFCAAELADQSLDLRRRLERRQGVERSKPAWVLGVAVGAAGLSYLTIATRGLLGGGGPAALAAGTVASMLAAFLVAFLVRTRARAGS